jgi:hypothetical protein
MSLLFFQNDESGLKKCVTQWLNKIHNRVTVSTFVKRRCCKLASVGNRWSVGPQEGSVTRLTYILACLKNVSSVRYDQIVMQPLRHK